MTGRLEDLPLSDIIQVVHLSRRTGSLDIDREGSIHRILFQKGMIVFAQSPESPDLESYLRRSSVLPREQMAAALELCRGVPGVPLGDLLLDMHHVTPKDLGSILYQGILGVVDLLQNCREGTFSFSLKETMTSHDLGYTPDSLFKAGGFSPARILQRDKDREISILKDIRESLTRGKELVRGDYVPAFRAAPVPSDGAPAPAPILPEHPAPRASVLTRVIPMNLEVASHARQEGEKVLSRFSISSKTDEDGLPGLDLLILESDPLLRVAAKRHFTKLGFKVQHYNAPGPFEARAAEVLARSEFSIFFMGVSQSLPYETVEGLLASLHRKGSGSVMLILHPVYNLERQHAASLRGADLVFIKPDLTQLAPMEAERSLQLFVEQLHLAVQRYIQGHPDLMEGSRFHDIGAKEKINRSFSLLKKLIEELAEPGDLSQICLMLLRVAAEYLERSVLLLKDNGGFVGMGGFGLTGDDVTMNVRVRSLMIPHEGDSIFLQVVESRKRHRGKLRRTPLNEAFMQSLGQVYPSEVIVLPILSQRTVIGFLYGDNAESQKPLGNTDGLEIFTAQAGPVFDTALRSHLKSEE